MIHKFYHIILIVVTIIIFQHQTLAPWEEKPEKPSEELTKNCEGWISHYGFTPDGSTNRELAKIRNRIYDPDVSLWAAGYACYLISFYSDEYRDPWDYCIRNYQPSQITKTHLSLNEAKEDCTFWIRLYGYDINDYFMRYHRAKKRDAQEDVYISIWAFFYAQFITKNVDNAEIKPDQFCYEIGKVTETNAEKMPFMSLYETRLSCQEWIELAGFTDDIEKNYELITSLNPKYHEIIFHHWTKQYINKFRGGEESDFNKFKLVLDLLASEKPKTEFKPKSITPEHFCIQIHCPISYKREFFK